jgi:bifunctional enzyme CysN/CysC
MSHKSDLIKEDILGYLKEHENKELLRFITCGSVDDGKSTLIGRLLHDSKLIYEDQLAAVRKDSEKRQNFQNNGAPDLSLIVDGLQAEREQGITIDVAYRYFSTKKRKFIIADTPGHEQYTRNMATGASTADLAVILIDANNGVLTQTRRHSFIVNLIGIKKIVVAVNKMDSVSYRQDVFEKIKQDYQNFISEMDFEDVRFIPISALNGDNVVDPGCRMDWYHGQSLMDTLETIPLDVEPDKLSFRMPVQYVNRPNSSFRGYCGTISTGVLRRGDKVAVLPSGMETAVKSIIVNGEEVEEAFSKMAVTVTTEDEVDISRGDTITCAENVPETANCFDSMLVWMGQEPLVKNRTYEIKSASAEMNGFIDEIYYEIDVNTLEKKKTEHFCMNSIGFARVNFSQKIAYEKYSDNRDMGSFILIDRVTNNTVAAGMIRAKQSSKNVVWHEHVLDKEDRVKLKGHKPAVLWLTGLSGSGKSTLANNLESVLNKKGVHTYILDGDNIRHGLNKDLGFSEGDRKENIRRIGEVAKLFAEAGVLVITAFISPFKADRDDVRKIMADGEFIEIFVDAPLEICEARDPKQLYKKARMGEITNFTGIGSPYEKPLKPDIHISTDTLSISESVDKVVKYLTDNKYM